MSYKIYEIVGTREPKTLDRLSTQESNTIGADSYTIDFAYDNEFLDNDIHSDHVVLIEDNYVVLERQNSSVGYEMVKNIVEYEFGLILKEIQLEPEEQHQLENFVNNMLITDVGGFDWYKTEVEHIHENIIEDMSLEEFRSKISKEQIKILSATFDTEDFSDVSYYAGCSFTGLPDGNIEAARMIYKLICKIHSPTNQD